MPSAAAVGHSPARMPTIRGAIPEPYADNKLMPATRMPSFTAHESGQSVDAPHDAARVVAVTNATAEALAERDRCLQGIHGIQAQFRLAADQRVIIANRFGRDIKLTGLDD